MILILEIAAGIVLGFLVTRLWPVRPCLIPQHIIDLLRKIEERPIVDDCSNNDRYMELLRRQFSDDGKLSDEEQLEFTGLAKEEQEFHKSRIGDVQTITILAHIQRTIKQELRESTTNLAKYIDERLRDSTTQRTKKD